MATFLHAPLFILLPRHGLWIANEILHISGQPVRGIDLNIGVRVCYGTPEVLSHITGKPMPPGTAAY